MRKKQTMHLTTCHEISGSIILKKKIYIKIKEINEAEWEIKQYFFEFLNEWKSNEKIKKNKALHNTITDMLQYFLNTRNKSYDTVKSSVDRLCNTLTPEFEKVKKEEYDEIACFFKEIYDFFER